VVQSEVKAENRGTALAFYVRTMSTFVQDIRYALRGLGRMPGFTAVVLLTVALGTGANAAVFSFIDALLLRPAAGVVDPAHLVAVFTGDYSASPYSGSSYPDYLSMKDDERTFAALAAYETHPAVLNAGGAAERVQALDVTGDFFAVVGLRPALGRLLNDADTAADAPRAVVVSDVLWRRTFAADPAIVGKTLMLGADTFAIVGVAPARFDALDLGDTVDVWTPMHAPAALPSTRGDRGLSIVGRLATGVSLDEAQGRLTALAHRLADAFPETNRGTLGHKDDPRPMLVLRHTRLGPEFRGQLTMIGAVLLAATTLVLLIACANVASLLLAQSTARRREISVRMAIGASRGRIARQLITESLVISAAGGALGLLVALWSIRLLPGFFPPDIARLLTPRMDTPELVLMLMVSIGAGVLFGLAPALHARRWNGALSVRAETQADGAGALGVRNALVMAQIALSCVLLVSTGVLVKSLTNLVNADLGFDTRAAVVASVEIPSARVSSEQGAQYYQDLLAMLRVQPGVEAASLASTMPLAQSGRRGFRITGYAPKPGESTELNVNVVDGRYFDVMGIPVLAGRTFDARDTATSQRVVVVNELMARRYFGGVAVGRHIVDSNKVDLEIVGVVRSGAYQTPQDPIVPFVYYPLAQEYRHAMQVVARMAANPATMIEPLRRAMSRVRPDVAVYRVITLESHLSEAIVTERLSAALVTTCGLLATLLAAIGVYGVMAYGVERRSREIGVRVALGARPGQIVGVVMREGLVLILLGTAVGLAAAAGGTRLLADLLFGVGLTDATTFVAAPLILGAVAIVAALVPLRRALRVDPMIILRQE
jgi:predicted permease